MKTNIFYLASVLLALISCTSASSTGKFLECLSKQFKNYSSISNNVYTPINSSYSSILETSIQNLRFFPSDSTSKPQVIITPKHESQIPPIIYCAKRTNIQIRTRSGGHDFEGLSYVSQVPFVIIDLINFSEIKVNAEEKTAWVGPGATIGSLYYRIFEKSPVLGFPGGNCPTIGLGGHFSGGGVGLMLRKYGLAADNVVDARIVDVSGRILDRKSMGEDLFWAIRGGGGASFGVITAWKVQLVDVPETVTVFRISKMLEQNATQLVHRWQHVAPNLDKDLLIAVDASRQNSTIEVWFSSMFLGGIDRLLLIMKNSFPELGLVREDCTEMSWIQSVVYIAARFPIETSPRVLLSRSNPFKGYFKAKLDYVQEPIPVSGIEGVWRHLVELEAGQARVEMVPYGGRMAEICDSAIPFPHRAGNLYEVIQMVTWDEKQNEDSGKYISFSRKLEGYLTPYVSKNPREAYLNARDLDLGVNNVRGKTSYEQASVWGKRYFKDNFDRLVRVKTVVDLENFFRNEQSIPSVSLALRLDCVSVT
ncbi:tetrahydrocannabinolic acid synthase-like [Salvia splendens]|uniref:tetrahydrocannabinolic acid synthase-like n=1 Tax=Salvia splendens TaxID=180675 RepID=UPI001C268A7D|nr:tetrahydrocannabinolic acid synthase-like [Salvia splendens]